MVVSYPPKRCRLATWHWDSSFVVLLIAVYPIVDGSLSHIKLGSIIPYILQIAGVLITAYLNSKSRYVISWMCFPSLIVLDVSPSHLSFK